VNPFPPTASPSLTASSMQVNASMFLFFKDPCRSENETFLLPLSDIMHFRGKVKKFDLDNRANVVYAMSKRGKLAEECPSGFARLLSLTRVISFRQLVPELYSPPLGCRSHVRRSTSSGTI
jgi:hypothetical protein